jgi:hypothetical protein
MRRKDEQAETTAGTTVTRAKRLEFDVGTTERDETIRGKWKDGWDLDAVTAEEGSCGVTMDDG